MRTRVSTFVVPLAAALQLVAPDLGAQGGTVLSVDYSVDRPRAALHLRVQALPGATVRLEGTSSLERPAWAPAAPPVLSTGYPFEWALALDPEASPRFFRVHAQPVEILVERSRTSYVLSNGTPASVGALLQQLSATAGRDVFPLEGEDLDRLVPAGRVEGATIEDLLEQFGLQAWVAPPPEDDAALFARYPAVTGRQADPLPDDPAEVGTGQIEERIPDDPLLPFPLPGPEDPPDPRPGPDDMTFDPGTPPAPGPQEELPSEEPGRHVQVEVRLHRAGGLVALEAFELPGDLRLSAPVPMPGANSVVFVARSAAMLEAGGVYHLGLLPDPFVRRSYAAPDGAPHGDEALDEAQVSFAVPLDADLGDYSTLTLEAYRYSGNLAERELTPAVFARHPEVFTALGSVTGAELQRLQGGRVRRAGAQGPAPDDLTWPGMMAPPQATLLLFNGPSQKKYDLVIVAEGFGTNQASQATFDTFVANVVMRDWLTRDIHQSVQNAMNLWRINTFSEDNSVTQTDKDGYVVSPSSTALGYRYSGQWGRCWMEPGPNSVSRLKKIVNALVPSANGLVVVLNTSGQGGCARSSHFSVTLGEGWDTFAHEFGHFFAGLGDEYYCKMGDTGCKQYVGFHLPDPNLAADAIHFGSDYDKFDPWRPNWRPVPTSLSEVGDPVQDVGVFAGATTGGAKYWARLYRPSFQGRMNNNTPLHNPVGDARVRSCALPYREPGFWRHAVGDFNGDGRQDLAVLNGAQLGVYQSSLRPGTPIDPIKQGPPRKPTWILDPAAFHNGRMTNPTNFLAAWVLWDTHQVLPGDFNGDGLDDLYIFNGNYPDFFPVNLPSWKGGLGLLRSSGAGFAPVRRFQIATPGWVLGPHDHFCVADFSGDGKDDLIIYNGVDWGQPHLILLRSTGADLEYVRRYDGTFPSYQMGRHEQLQVGDFNGDGRQDLVALNRTDWAQPRLLVLLSLGTKLFPGAHYLGAIDWPDGGTFWTLRKKDQVRVLDYTGDGRSDLALYNGNNWAAPYLGLMASVGGGLVSPAQRYDQFMPGGWQLRPGDRLEVGDVNGDNLDDLIALNVGGWIGTQLGLFRSDGSGLTSSHQSGSIGLWHWDLQANGLAVGDFSGGGRDDLFVFTPTSLGLLRSYGSKFASETVYPRFITNYRFTRSGNY